MVDNCSLKKKEMVGIERNTEKNGRDACIIGVKMLVTSEQRRSKYTKQVKYMVNHMY